MQNLRITSVQVVDSSNIDVTFTESLTPNLIPANVSIISDSPNVPSSEVLTLKISQNLLSITCQPLTPLGSYFLQLQSVPSFPFISLNGDAKMPEDGVTNRFSIIGPLEAENPIRNYLGSFYQGNIYDLGDDNTLVSKYIKSLSILLSKALYDIRQSKNENYLSFDIIDEQKVRGSGPFDRLNEEGAYEITRVGLGESTANATATFPFPVFPVYPVTLQKQPVAEILTPNSVDIVGQFNINSLTFNLSSSPVTRVTSIVFTLGTANPVYTYDIPKFGYQIKDSRYDQDFGFNYALLKDNQIKISDQILKDPLFSLENIIRVDIQYEYKNLGVVVDTTTVNVYTLLDSIREVLPPIENVFNLQHSPIVDSNGDIVTLGGITFSDPNNPTSLHPAFVYEIPFRLNSLPVFPGQYSIDYSSGTVYVFGSDLSNSGTGASPPLATYKYKFTYKPEQDYVLDPDSSDLVSLPLGNLRGFDGTITFKYEEVLIPNVDYVAGLHQEVLTERIGNNLLALNTLKTQKSPITNVFRILNETSGEIYTLSRWNDNKVYFRYNTPPRIISTTEERVFFNPVVNELLFVNSTLINSGSLRIFKIFLSNNTITSSTEDSLASSFNTSLSFTNGNIFITEKWFNRQQDELDNINRLLSIGQYMIDYSNGVIYIAVSNTQDINIGTVTYKNSDIVPTFPHVISVEDIFYRISALNPKNKSFSYLSFEDGVVVPKTIEPSDELFLNNSVDAPYQINNGSVGVFYNASFVPGVTNQIKFVRSLFEYSDLLNSTHPLNFASTSTSSGFNVNVSPINKTIFSNVQFDGTNFFVIIDENVPYLSSNITYSFSVIRTSDGAALWNNTGTVVPGGFIKLILPGINSPTVGDLVSINYTFTINNLSRIVLDYNKGDLFIDYTYLADEIIISYEYGDNVLDFRLNKNVPAGTQYFASYKAGALRDALLKNFGTLVNVPELANFDIDFDRERYRDALTAALSSFIQGPTISAIKNIGKTISHIEPQVSESVFQGWSLGSSLLNPEPISTTGNYQLLPAKFGNGVLVDKPDQTITFPLNSNFRIEEGTFESWIAPQWNGLDNDAKLTFTITRTDGIIIKPTQIFVGASEFHPNIVNGSFTLDKNTNVVGKPNTNKDGIFIYYDKDISGNFYRWYLEVIDGYVSPFGSGYKFKISSSDNFYDVKSTISPKPSNMNIFSGVNTVNLTINPTGGAINEGITFLSDPDHYLLDFGENKNTNRFSFYKDVSGYLVFRVIDKDHNVYSISADVSYWKSGDLHHVAISWKLNTRNDRDEMHLFIDGLEVPNIIKYNQKLKPYLHEKFRTVDPEEIIGLSHRDIVGSIDLHTTTGSDTVSSSINFSAFNIFPGDTIFIDEVGFSSLGYTINSINGQTLTLSSAMPTTFADARFSVNRTQFNVVSDINVAPNLAVYTVNAMFDGYDIEGYTGSNVVSSDTVNFSTLGVLPGYLIRIPNIPTPNILTIIQVNNHSLILSDPLTVDVPDGYFFIYPNTETEIPGLRALRPSYSISQDSNFNNIITISNNVFADDLILIKTLGLNYKRIKKQHYVWSNSQENVLMTRLPPPISLDNTFITKVILPTTAIGVSNSINVGGVFYSNDLSCDPPSNAQNGRTISVTLSGNNVDFSHPVTIVINGVSGVSTINESITFDDYGTLDFVHPFHSVNYVRVVVKPINPLKNATNIYVKEKYPITHSEFSGSVPVIKYSYHIGGGYNLQNDGYNLVRDGYNLFSGLDINNCLLIHSPPSVAGFYTITGLSTDRKSISIDPTNAAFPLPLPPFTNGVYQVLNTTQYRSGLQNGFYTFEVINLPGEEYFLSKGFYELDYFTYASIKFDKLSKVVYLGSDFMGKNQAHVLMDDVNIMSTMLTDTRIGESIPANQKSITKDFNALKAPLPDTTTLMLIDFDSFPFVNSAHFYINSNTDKNHFQSSSVVNENFGNSLVILDKPIILSNDGILDTKKEGTIEMWVSPMFETANDPHERYYFDAFGAVIEETVSVDAGSVKISSPASKILSVKLKAGDSGIDYFAGGKLEIDTQHAIAENVVSFSNSIVTVSKPILQVITVKIAGDFTGTDYFANGVIGTDRQTIYLGKPLPLPHLSLIVTYQSTENKNQVLNTQVIRLNRKLPNQNSHVVVNYIPRGLQGDRIVLYKDIQGYLNFGITASGTDYVISAPIRWARHTWHRIKASYKFNSGTNLDEMRLFIDGYQYNDVLFGTGIVMGKFPFVMGSVTVGDGYGLLGNIIFKDPINELFIGSKFTGEGPLFNLVDNVRISNVFRPIYAPYGEPIDVNYNSNIEAVFPVTSDLFTTYLLNSNKILTLNTDFSTLVNRKTGLFDFSVNILDSLGIVNSSQKVKEVLETLIKILKPANSRVFIQYTK